MSESVSACSSRDDDDGTDTVCEHFCEHFCEHEVREVDSEAVSAVKSDSRVTASDTRPGTSASMFLDGIRGALFTFHFSLFMHDQLVFTMSMSCSSGVPARSEKREAIK